MKNNILQKHIDRMKQAFGPLSTSSVEKCRLVIEELARDPAGLPTSGAEGVEIYQDPDTGFLLISYTENKDHYRDPHDHGSAWVIYAVTDGEVEMGTFAKAFTPDGRMHLVERERYRMKKGDCKVFLPGDIHDTLCASSNATLLRLTSCDLKEEQRAGRMIRYLDRERS